MIVAIGNLAWVPTSVNTNTYVENQISWSPDQKLRWSDFRGAAPFGHAFDAESYAGIGFTYTPVRRGDRVLINWEVTAYFDRKASWVNRKSATDRLLAHEQVHFDIAEIFARQLRARLRKTRLTVDNVNKVMEEYLDDALADMSTYNNRYDRETRHGLVREAQAEWQQKVRQRLRDRNEPLGESF